VLQSLLCSGKRLVIRDKQDEPEKRKIVVLSKDAVQIGDPAFPPTEVGATLTVSNTGMTTDTQTFDIPAGAFDKVTKQGWKALGKPAGSKGYKYIDRFYTNGPCKLVLIKPGRLLKAVCLNKKEPYDAISYTLEEDEQEAVAVKLTVGGDDYCMVFEDAVPDSGETVKKDWGTGVKPNGVGMFKAVNAAAPGSCPIP
jgi:hypothetical protein